MGSEFKKIWSSYFNKTNAILVENGKTAIIQALISLKSKKVALPTYTCHRILEACLKTNCNPYIVDCGLDLQIDINKIPEEVDTVIIPHMFGIQVNIKPLQGKFKIIEDCSQCIGLPNLGRYSDIVIASTGPTKWLNAGESKEKGGGILAFNGSSSNLIFNPLIENKLNHMFVTIDQTLKSRTSKANELINAGIDLIGKNQPNAWLRALYFGSQKRVPYTPLHDIYPGFKCPVVDSYKNKLDWISIFP
tara:strand:+ start:1529 stop:2272 length:744 start_codon:yes stop_codon:yes gene_type:complete